jgi:hypothetical protein
MVYVIQFCRQLANRIRMTSSQAVCETVWHIPLLCVQWDTPDDGQRNCPKHVEFHSKNKFEKLVHLVGFIIQINQAARSHERQTCRWSSQACPKLRELCTLDIPENARPQDLYDFAYAFRWASYFTFCIFIPRAKSFREVLGMTPRLYGSKWLTEVCAAHVKKLIHETSQSDDASLYWRKQTKYIILLLLQKYNLGI